ncbi:uncharacterized protein LOC135369481 [Ornithodoros turicata]|uniref:uncharacterized protein LOC135369481 n=1 Tax=Ornithodoros turicata TaxID=34597 RepID=UPI003139ACD7
MRFALIIAALVAGALAGPVVEPFEVLDEDSVSLPDFEFTGLGLHRRDVKFTQGKVEGLSTVLSPLRGCNGRYKGQLSVSGLNFTYKAVATHPDQEFDVVVEVLHGLTSVDSERAYDESLPAKDHRVRALHQYVRQPVEFTSDRLENRVFEELLKQKLAQLLDQLTQTESFEHFFKNVV